MKVGSILVLCLLFFSCKETKVNGPNEGIWRAELAVMDNEILPFNFKLTTIGAGEYRMETYNAEEVIAVDEIQIEGDSIIIKMPVFEGYIAGTFTEEEISGSFVKESLDRIVPFKAIHGEKDRFSLKNSANAPTNVAGIWETSFSEGTEDHYMGKGFFVQEGNKVTGTFRTATGDYRYLDGVVDGDSLKISAFDGAHAFLFTAKITDSTLNGTFYSGNHFKEPFVAKRNPSFELPDADSLTFLNEGYDAFDFSFPDTDGSLVSLTDERFKNKVVIVQIMGTWCPNCLDETKFYVNYLNTHKNEELEVIGLAFESAKTQEKGFRAINRLKARIGVDYPILLAQYGGTDKEMAQKKLPMLNHVLSYPTSIFIDKEGKVRKIHTGFNGPATGEKFVTFKKEFHEFVTSLLNQ